MDRILIVEDDNNINQMVYEMFNKCGYECTSAFSGTEALLRMENSNFDLIILDLMLPGMSGDEVLKNIIAFYDYIEVQPMEVYEHLVWTHDFLNTIL